MNKKNIVLIIILVISGHLLCHPDQPKTFTIMLDPAGDARETGRIIEDSLERAVTVQCAQALQEAIEFYVSNCKIIVTRTPGEEVSQLQRANFANRLAIDLYININIVLACERKPTLYVYQFSLGDISRAPSQELAMVSYDKAHKKAAPQTTAYGKKITSFLSRKEHQKTFLTQNLYQLPFAPLMGIQAPALGLELSISSEMEWKKFINPIAQSIAFALEQ